jgi:hypothetical protein
MRLKRNKDQKVAETAVSDAFSLAVEAPLAICNAGVGVCRHVESVEMSRALAT